MKRLLSPQYDTRGYPFSDYGTVHKKASFVLYYRSMRALIARLQVYWLEHQFHMPPGTTSKDHDYSVAMQGPILFSRQRWIRSFRPGVSVRDRLHIFLYASKDRHTTSFASTDKQDFI